MCAPQPGCRMKLDESAHDLHSVIEGHQAGCMDAAALKLSKMGGLTAMRQIRDLCLSLGTQMCIEDTWGSDGHHCRASASPRHLLRRAG